MHRSKRELQQIDRKAVELERHLVGLPGVIDGAIAEEVASELEARLLPKFDAIQARFNQLEAELASTREELYRAICYPPNDGHGP